ncbi:hypothetical protein STEG23_010575 [Scotinomys teguina]
MEADRKTHSQTLGANKEAYWPIAEQNKVRQESQTRRMPEEERSQRSHQQDGEWMEHTKWDRGASKKGALNAAGEAKEGEPHNVARKSIAEIKVLIPIVPFPKMEVIQCAF